MARVLFGTPIKGSVGSTVTQGGRSGAVQRLRVIPTNPQTVSQQTQRMILGTCASEWRGLSNDQRAAWEALAAQIDPNLTGFNIYVRVNATRLTCSQAKVEDAPLPVAFGVLSVEGLTSVAGVVKLLQVSDTVAPDKFMIEATAQSSQGISNRNSKFRLITVVDGAAGPADIDISAAYVAKFGALTADAAIQVRITPQTTGFKGVALKFTAING